MSILQGLAIFVLVLIPFVPVLLRIRIRFFRWIHWDWAVRIHEKYFDRFVLIARVWLFVIAIALQYFAI